MEESSFHPLPHIAIVLLSALATIIIFSDRLPSLPNIPTLPFAPGILAPEPVYWLARSENDFLPSGRYLVYQDTTSTAEQGLVQEVRAMNVASGEDALLVQAVVTSTQILEASVDRFSGSNTGVHVEIHPLNNGSNNPPVKVAFFRTRNNPTRIAEISASRVSRLESFSGQQSVSLTRGTAQDRPVILFEISALKEQGSVYDASTKQRALPHGDHLIAEALSEDGNRVYFSSLSAKGGFEALWKYDIAANTSTMIFGAADQFVYAPATEQFIAVMNGTSLLDKKAVDDNCALALRSRLELVDGKTGAKQSLISDASFLFDVGFSQDGNRISYHQMAFAPSCPQKNVRGKLVLNIGNVWTVLLKTASMPETHLLINQRIYGWLDDQHVLKGDVEGQMTIHDVVTKEDAGTIFGSFVGFVDVP